MFYGTTSTYEVHIVPILTIHVRTDTPSNEKKEYSIGVRSSYSFVKGGGGYSFVRLSPLRYSNLLATSKFPFVRLKKMPWWKRNVLYSHLQIAVKRPRMRWIYSFPLDFCPSLNSFPAWFADWTESIQDHVFGRLSYVMIAFIIFFFSFIFLIEGMKNLLPILTSASRVCFYISTCVWRIVI